MIINRRNAAILGEKTMKSFRQGDVAGIQIDKLPSGCVEVPPTKEGKIILAWGEKTLHHHRVEGVTQEAPKVRLWSAGAERFLQVLARSELSHEEHSTVVLEPGIYLLPGQYEMNCEHEVRRVAD